MKVLNVSGALVQARRIMWVNLCVLALILSACGSRAAELTHPLESGNVEPNAIMVGRDSAAITEFNAEKLCFDLRGYRESPEGEPLAGVNAPVPLKVAGNVRTDGQFVQLFEETRGSYEGTVSEEQQTGTTRECVRRERGSRECEEWVTRPLIERVSVPATFYTVQFGGIYCFENSGSFTLDTRELEMNWEGHRFVWKFKSLAD